MPDADADKYRGLEVPRQCCEMCSVFPPIYTDQELRGIQVWSLMNTGHRNSLADALYLAMHQGKGSHTMGDPANLDEFNARAIQNTAVTGYGFDGVTMSTPCPFCAAADHRTYKVLHAATALEPDITCRECGRSSKWVVNRGPGGSMAAELVRTNDVPPPAWMVENNLVPRRFDESPS